MVISLSPLFPFLNWLFTKNILHEHCQGRSHYKHKDKANPGESAKGSCTTLYLLFFFSFFVRKNYSLFYPIFISLAAYISSHLFHSFFFSSLHYVLGTAIGFTQHYTFAIGKPKKKYSKQTSKSSNVQMSWGLWSRNNRAEGKLVEQPAFSKMQKAGRGKRRATTAICPNTSNTTDSRWDIGL